MIKATKGQLEFFEWFDTLVFCAAAIVLLFLFVARPATVQGISMNPTLSEGDRLIVRSAFYEPEYGDVVVIDAHSHYGEPLVKRVIGVAGDTIDINFETGEVYLNDQLLSESYIAEPTYRSGDTVLPLTLGENQVFVMGDNRNDSVDSRDSMVGIIDKRSILGEAEFIIFPFDNFGMIENPV